MATLAQTSHSAHLGRKWRILAGALVLALALAAALGAAGGWAKSRLMNEFPAPGRLVHLDENTMHIVCVGQGRPTVILEAGLDDFSMVWGRVQPEVSKFARVCSYDRAGMGWSSASRSPRAISNMVNELHSLLLKAQVEPPYVLVGHSFGGAIVRLYAHEYPNEAAGMVLVDAAHEDLFTRIPKWRLAIENKLGLYRALAPLSAWGLLALTPNTIPDRGLPDGTLMRYQAVVVATNYFATAISENQAFEQNLADVRAAHLTNLGELPLVVLSSGRWDVRLPGITDEENEQARRTWGAMQKELAGLSSIGEQVVVEQSGHSIQLEEPQVVVDAIRRVEREAYQGSFSAASRRSQGDSYR